ncbi:hypothetical protein RO3G_05079 [Rhizopus delemar RA 99-880]|uniref:Uncharacterized protein n=1 Tax=Rhizopus delemar (strain RA 99-880 / ATCC MYA-4621 / FGSC 9543 / NRRL 43880) TaxID=246409 RepID=I1BVZ4_RHIO9|nr:hypothetical protein RO3G_05079 [Rhizopus delemar RA 99-880]|eukprot:EIE80374.1 hypothetical protein RO3G_05079 [Rhizopus delemar RA 99-880]
MALEVMDYTKRFPDNELPGNNQALHVYSSGSIRLTRSLFKDYLLTFVIKFGIKPKNHLHMDSEACRVLDDLERYKYIFVIFSSDTIRYLEK